MTLCTAIKIKLVSHSNIMYNVINILVFRSDVRACELICLPICLVGNHDT